jgi:hypothetical protein
MRRALFERLASMDTGQLYPVLYCIAFAHPRMRSVHPRHVELIPETAISRFVLYRIRASPHAQRASPAC